MTALAPGHAKVAMLQMQISYLWFLERLGMVQVDYRGIILLLEASPSSGSRGTKHHCR